MFAQMEHQVNNIFWFKEDFIAAMFLIIQQFMKHLLYFLYQEQCLLGL